MRKLWLWLGLMCVGLLFAGCGGTAAQTPPAPAATLSPTEAATAAPTATATLVIPTQTTLTCPTTVNGSEKVFDDSVSGLSFSYPASWTEADCQRITSSDGSQSLIIGNLFIVSIWPRNGLSIQQWVNQEAGSGEAVALATLSVKHAVEAESVTVTTTGQSTQPPRFGQTLAIVAGNQNFYEVSGLVAQMSMTDTLPGLSGDQLVQQVVTTFDVP